VGTGKCVTVKGWGREEKLRCGVGIGTVFETWGGDGDKLLSRVILYYVHMAAPNEKLTMPMDTTII